MPRALQQGKATATSRARCVWGLEVNCVTGLARRGQRHDMRRRRGASVKITLAAGTNQNCVTVQTTDIFLFIEYTKCVFRGSEQLLSKPRFGDYSFFHLAALPFLMSRQGQYVCLHGRLHMRGSSRPRSAWELCFHFIHFPWACTLLQGWPRNVVGLWSQEGDGADDAGPGGHVAEFRLYSQGTEESEAGMHLR